MATDIAPPLPEKSKLRARKISTPDVIPSPPPPSLHASSSPTVPDNNNNNNNNSSSSSKAPSLEKKIKSRFTEHFDHIPPPELLEELAETDFHVPTVRKPQSQKTAGTLSKTLRPFLQTSNSATTLNINAGSDIVLTPSASSPNRSNVDNKRPPLSSSSFWPRSLSSRNLGNQTSDEEAAAVLPSHSEDEEKSVKKKTFFGAAGRKKGKEKEKDKENKEAIAEDANAVSSTSTSNNNKSNVIQSLFSLNRAEVIITRLENWHHVLKSISGWLEEVAKVSFQNSRCYSQRALPLVKNDNGSEGHHHRDAMATMQTGLQMLTMQLAAEQKEFGKRIQHDFLPGLLKLRKECKEMIRGLKEEPELVMDELLRRAETTRKSMAALNKCCKAAESAQHTIDDDPWLANLYVLRQLKREVDEENRMRELMVPIQKGTAAFEARAIEHLKQAIEFCYTRLSPAMWDGTTGEDSDTPPYKLVLRHIMPDYEWERFFESKKKDLVNPENPRKDYLRINYPNKLNPVVMTLAKGVLERRAGVRKQFVERYFVLSQCGYFYEFAMSDKVSPERSIYIPDTTIVPSIDISHLAAHESAAENPAQGYTFEIHKRGTQMLHRDKTYVYRAQSREELLSWCRLLCEVAARGSRGGPPIKHILAPSGGGGGGPHHCPPSMPRSVSSSLSFTTTDRPNNGSTVSVPTVRAPSVASVKPIDKDQVPTSVNRRREPSTPETHTPTSATNKIPAAATDEASVQELDVASEEPKLRAKQQEDHDSDDENNKHADANIEEQPPTTPTVTQKMDESENLKTLDADDAASILTARPDAEQVERPESRASTHFTDTESSVYFSSRSADPSPNGSVASLTAPPPIEQFAIPELENERNPAPQAGGYFYSPKLSSPMPWKADEA